MADKKDTADAKASAAHGPATPFSQGIELVLAAAAMDEVFRERFLADPLTASDKGGYELTPAERAILQAVPSPQLESTIESLAAQSPQSQHSGDPAQYPDLGVRVASHGIRPRHEVVKGIRPGRKLVAAAVTTAVVGGGAAMLLSFGNRPDKPEKPAVTQPLVQPADGGPDTDDVDKKAK